MFFRGLGVLISVYLLLVKIKISILRGIYILNEIVGHFTSFGTLFIR